MSCQSFIRSDDQIRGAMAAPRILQTTSAIGMEFVALVSPYVCIGILLLVHSNDLRPFESAHKLVRRFVRLNYLHVVGCLVV